MTGTDQPQTPASAAELAAEAVRTLNHLTIHRDGLHLPLTWRKPRRIFVNSMSDLFHADVPDAFIAEVFAVIALAERHTFQVLTKRHGRMKSLLNSAGFQLAVRANLRIPALLDTPAEVRWISAEPLLGPVDLNHVGSVDVLDPNDTGHENGLFWVPGPALDWVVVGGESGPRARPMHPDWVRRLRNQCAAAGVPFLFKQWGAYGELPKHQGDLGVTVSSKDGTVYHPGDLTYPDGPRYGEALRAGHAGTLHAMYRVGKKAAGRELDGVVHDAYPAVTS